VFETVSRGLEEIKRLRAEYEDLSMQEWTDEVGHRLDQLYSLIDANQGWAWEQKVEEVLHQLHLEANRLMF
jgi:ATP-binding cassette subfamily F protein uup